MRLVRKILFRGNRHLTYIQCKYLSTSVSLLNGSQHNVDKSSSSQFNEVSIDLRNFPPDRIRNFGVIAHIDHGKSTFSDRLLEMSGLISKETIKPQYLDKLEVERERGITVKAQTVSLVFQRNGQPYLLNLIDTPGHVDFSFEVYRSLPVCQGAILLVDATKGVQAQTIAHFNQALLGDVNLIPVINKIDVKEANVKSVEDQLINLFSFSPEEIYKISAKTGEGCDKVVEAIIDKILPPMGNIDNPLKGFYFDSWSHQVHGIISLASILEGKVNVGDKIYSLTGKKAYTVREVGIFYPEETPVETLYAGQVGYLSACIRDESDGRIGDAFIEESNYNELKSKNPSIIETMVNDLPKIPKPRSMVFAGIFPAEPSQSRELKSALNKLILNDSSVEMEPDSSPAFGFGWRLGFLGLLHMDVFTQRLEAEYDAPTVITAPSVSYKVTIKGNKNIKQYGKEILTIKNPMHLPPENIIVKFDEPWVIGSIITPNHLFGPINLLCLDRRCEQIDSSYVDQERILLKYKMPLNEIILDFYDQLKVITSGYASFDYEESEYIESPIVKVNFLLNGKLIEELTSLVHKNKSYSYAKAVCKKLKDNLPPQLFKIAIQGAIGTKIIARETMDALRKDVTAKLYGGDVTRAQKLLARQKEGKARLRMIGDIQVERDTFIKILKTIS